MCGSERYPISAKTNQHITRIFGVGSITVLSAVRPVDRHTSTGRPSWSMSIRTWCLRGLKFPFQFLFSLCRDKTSPNRLYPLGIEILFYATQLALRGRRANKFTKKEMCSALNLSTIMRLLHLDMALRPIYFIRHHPLDEIDHSFDLGSD